nr:fasciclin domain-containing protein [Pedobacter panaciterrae]
MKKSILNGRSLWAFIFAVLILQAGCKREQGFYDANLVIDSTNLNSYEYLKSKPGQYDSVLYLIDKLGIKEELSTGAVTLFAPSNESFRTAIKNLNDARAATGKSAIYLKDIVAGQVGKLTTKDKKKAAADSAHLDTMVSRYIVKDLKFVSDFALGDGQGLLSIRGNYPMHGQRIYADAQGYQNGGSEVIEFSNTKRSIFVDKWEKTTTTSVNIKTKNGVVHLLNPNHIFGFEEFVPRLTVVPPPPVVFDYVNDVFFPTFQNPDHFDGQINPGEKMAKALDGNILTKFISNFSATNGNVTMNWIPKVPTVSNSYTITSANDSKGYQFRDPRAWRVEATLSDDPRSSSAVWVQIDSRQDQEFTTNYQRKIYDFKNNVAYKGYRLRILQGWTPGSNQIQLSEWTMNFREE